MGSVGETSSSYSPFLPLALPLPLPLHSPQRSAIDVSGLRALPVFLRQRKVHLQTLRERSEVEKMSPRERMRLRKLQAADERARKLKQIVEEKYQENHHRMRELRSRHFQKISVNVLKEDTEDTDPHTQPITGQNCTTGRHSGPIGEQLPDRLNTSEQTDSGGPDLVDAVPGTVPRRIPCRLGLYPLLVDPYDRTLPYTCRFSCFLHTMVFGHAHMQSLLLANH
ncbi:hypothetical protein NFI96_004445 [Prochilodus magdalenae]|nr:hypothetical protein NFI96_004445 [Prochilodus magdalenae]